MNIERKRIDDVLQSMLDNLPPTSERITRNLRHLVRLSRDELARSARDHVQRETFLRECHVDNSNTTKLKRDLNAFNKSADSRVNDLTNQIRDEQRAIQMEIERVKLTAIKCIMDSEKRMRNASRLSDTNVALMHEELEMLETKHARMLDVNVRVENQMRLQRRKTHAQLVNFVEKYEQTMAEKNDELARLTDERDGEIRRLEGLRMAIDEQDPGYNALMAEKYRLEREIFERKLERFTFTVAAVRIQRWWRRLMRVRAEKARKAKKKAGKKKK